LHEIYALCGNDDQAIEYYSWLKPKPRFEVIVEVLVLGLLLSSTLTVAQSSPAADPEERWVRVALKKRIEAAPLGTKGAFGPPTQMPETHVSQKIGIAEDAGKTGGIGGLSVVNNQSKAGNNFGWSWRT